MNKDPDIMGKLAAIAGHARDFIWDPENWEQYEDMKTSNSVDIPVSFMALGHAVEDLYGTPPWATKLPDLSVEEIAEMEERNARHIKKFGF